MMPNFVITDGSGPVPLVTTKLPSWHFFQICQVTPDTEFVRQLGIHSTAEFLLVNDEHTIKMQNSAINV